MNNNKAHTHAHEEGDGDMWGEREGRSENWQTDWQTNKNNDKDTTNCAKNALLCQNKMGKNREKEPSVTTTNYIIYIMRSFARKQSRGMGCQKRK